MKKTLIVLVALLVAFLLFLAIYMVLMTGDDTIDVIEPVVVTPKTVTEVQGVYAIDDLNDAEYIPERNLLVVTSFDEQKMYFISPELQKINDEVEVSYPHKMLAIPGGDELLIAASGGRVFKLSLDTLTVTAEAKVGDHPSEMAFDTERNRLLVVNEYSNSVSIIDLDSFKVLDTIPVGNRPVDVVVDYTGQFAYVSNDKTASISVISLANHSVIDEIYDVGRPGRLLAYPERNLILVLDTYNDQVRVIDGDTNMVIKSMAAVSFPSDIAISSDSKTLYVTGYLTSELGVFDLDNEQMTEKIQMGSSFTATEGLNNVVLIEETGELLITNTNTGQIFFVAVE